MIILIVEERFFPKDTNVNFIDTVCEDATLISIPIYGRDFRIYRDRNALYTHDDIDLKKYIIFKKDIDSSAEEEINYNAFKNEIDCNNDTYIEDFKDLEAGEYEIQLMWEKDKDYESGIIEYTIVLDNIIKLKE